MLVCEDQHEDWQINTMEEKWKHLTQSLDLVEFAGGSALRSSSVLSIAVPRTLNGIIPNTNILVITIH
jgi:hypothetical protein